MKALLLDSNVFIRLLTQDVKDQYETAKEIFKSIEEKKIIANVSILVVNEVIWILENYYKMKRVDYIPQLRNLLSLNNVRIIEAKKEVILSCLGKMEDTNFDFTDVYLFHATEKGDLFSFDRDFEKLSRN